MPREMVIIVCFLLIGAWFVLGKGSVTEKITIAVGLFALYIAFKVMSGSTVDEVFSIFNTVW